MFILDVFIIRICDLHWVNLTENVNVLAFFQLFILLILGVLIVRCAAVIDYQIWVSELFDSTIAFLIDLYRLPVIWASNQHTATPRYRPFSGGQTMDGSEVGR